ncbi:hypothetical protein [Desulfogranum marinum]|uniref:hypothetical protein n=1 Tax=Desulfogranum marinum TaxID=453220 RepID=UPI001965B1F7|nr:hypothetical protein [Desulfogranum marinum]MBM9513611.1 hypothetical protein [Desulfogranum marinum]
MIGVSPGFVAGACQATTGRSGRSVSTYAKGITTVIIEQGDTPIGAEDKTLYFRAAAITDDEVVNCSARMVPCTGGIAICQL